MIDGKLQLKHAPASKKSDINKTKNIKNIITRYRIADQQKAGNQGRDDSVKQFNIYNPTLHIVTLEKKKRIYSRKTVARETDLST